MRQLLIIPMLFLNLVSIGYCSDGVTLIGVDNEAIHPHPRKISEKFPETNRIEQDNFQSMKNLLQTETTKKKENTILDLEIDKLKKQKEILELNSQLNVLKASSGHGVLDPNNIQSGSIIEKIPHSASTASLDIRLTYFVYSKDYKEALLSINNVLYSVHDGSGINNIQIKEIMKDGVLIQHSNGEEEKLEIYFN